jgi:branched-chain amino acid transport system permease protein
VLLIRKVAGGLAAAVLIVLAWALAAAAQSGGGPQVTGFVRNETEQGGQTVREPVQGVKIAFEAANGTSIGTVSTAADGSFSLNLPGPGDYVAKLDQSSLPKGVTLRNPTDAVRTFSVTTDQAILNYFLGKDTRKTESRIHQLPQTIVNGLKLGFIIAMAAVGLSLIYGTTGLSNFAHGELVALGALVTWYFNQRGPKFNVLIAALFGIAATALAAWLMEAGVFRPMRRRGIGLTSAMIVSIGIGIAARYVYQYFFGGRTKTYRQYTVQHAWDIGPISITPREMLTMAVAVVVLVGIALFLQRTRAGKAVRAVSDNPALSSATGINTDRVIALVWIIGGGLAGFGGVLLGLDQGVKWDMGFGLLLLMFAAITLGGLGNPYGALVGSLVIGLFNELWTWVFPSVIELKTMGALIVLIVVLLVRPQGLLGRKERVG